MPRAKSWSGFPDDIRILEYDTSWFPFREWFSEVLRCKDLERLHRAGVRLRYVGTHRPVMRFRQPPLPGGDLVDLNEIGQLRGRPLPPARSQPESELGADSRQRTAGPVVVNFAPPVPASNDFGFSGTVKDTEFLLRPDQGIRSADDMFQAIIGGNAYVNVHSSVNPGGEIRGQLVLKQ